MIVVKKVILVMATILIMSLLSGCFFSVEKMVVDPDKTILHSEEVKTNGIQAKTDI